MVHFDRTIPPGGEGKITLRVDTKGLQGHLHKRAKVYSNSPQNEIEIISIKAFVRPSINISAKSLFLQGLAGETVSRTITIRAESERPLELVPTHFDLSHKLSYKIEEVEAGKVFRIHFRTIPGPAEDYDGTLKLKTNYPKKPEITIRIRGHFKERVQN